MHIENNLKRARGTQEDDFSHRLVNILWQGNPKNPLDYLASEEMAKLTAIKLVQLLLDTQQRAPALKLNIIAHSEGNTVLLYALEILGQLKHPIEHAFFWQAAIPHTALSPNPKTNNPGLSGHWGTVHACMGSQHHHVLFSRHDNILGPLNFTDKPNLLAHKRQESPYHSMAIASVIAIDLFDQLELPNTLNSTYAIAQRLGQPIDLLLLNSQSRNIWYQHWWNTYHDNNPKLAADLGQQGQQLANHSRSATAWHNLCTLLEIFYALTINQLKYHMQQTDTQLAIARMQASLHPSEHQQLLNHLAARISEDILSLETQIIEQLKAYGISEKHLKSWIKAASITLAHWIFHALFNTANHPDYQPRYQDIHIQIVHKTGIGALIDRIRLAIFCDLAEHLRPYIVNKLPPMPQPKHPEAFIKQSAQEMATIIITLMSTKGALPPAALGYSGPDPKHQDPQIQKLIKQGKIITLDQSDWLFSHSGMKYASATTIQKSYAQGILNAVKDN